MKQINRRDFLSSLAIGAASCAISNCAIGQIMPQKNKKPNIVFILADDLGWGDLGCYGNTNIKTPNLNNIAKEGTLFTHFYVCGASCAPTRTSFMTGAFPPRYGIHFALDRTEVNKSRGCPDFLNPNAPMITRFLQKAGYAVGHFGKWHLGGGAGQNPNAPSPIEYGIDEFKGYSANGPKLRSPDFNSHSSKMIIDESIRFIKENKDRNFYVNVWLKDPHAPLDPTEEQMSQYNNFGPKGALGQKYKGAMQVYYATVTEMDKQIGRLFEKIKELGLDQDTIIVFSSDNGPEDIHVPNSSYSGVGSPGPFRGRKRSIYEGGIRMPFIVRWPSHCPADNIDDSTIISSADWLASVCSLVNIKLPEDIIIDGQDMSNAFVGKPKQRTKPLMWERRLPHGGYVTNLSPMLAIRHGKWKLMLNPDKSRVELYDIPDDPSELNNLANRYPDVVDRLAKIVLNWQKTLPPGPISPDAGTNAYPWPKKRKEEIKK